MFAKTFCKPGSQVCPVPAGLQVTLQYSAQGVLEKIFADYSKENNVTDKLLSKVQSVKGLTSIIPIRGGTTWVYGVFHTDTIYPVSGSIPQCAYESMMKDICEDPDQFTFYAGSVESLAAAFNSVIAIRNWLNMSKFHVLPMYMIHQNMDDRSFEDMLNRTRYPFIYSLTSGYLIFDTIPARYLPLNVLQGVVTSVDREEDSSGYIWSVVKTKDKSVRKFHYADVAKMSVKRGSIIVVESGRLIYSSTKDSVNKVTDLVCDTCGKVFKLPASGPTCCDDPNCLSRMYPRVEQAMNRLELPVITYEKYHEYVVNKDITCLADIFLVPEYSTVCLSCTISSFLSAFIPVDICNDSSLFTKIGYLCRGSKDTFVYYLDNVNRLYTDLNSPSFIVKRFMSWVSDPHNNLMLKTLMEGGHITIIEPNKAFDGAPVFKGRVIAITGRFNHGHAEDIISIFKSYEADNVTIGIDGRCDCLVVGDMKEEIDGQSIQIAKDSNIPIFTESQFFNMFDIDADLAENLL